MTKKLDAGGTCVLIKRLLITISLLVLLFCCGAQAACYIDETPPSDWDERSLLRLYVFPTYQSDCMVLEVGEERMFMEGGRINWMEKVGEALQRYDLTQVDYLFSSHPHPDHIQNMCYLLKNEYLRGEIFVTPFDYQYEYVYLQEMEAALEELGIPYYQMANGEVLRLGDAELTLLRNDNGRTTNSQSGVLKVTFGDASLLLTSDIDGDACRFLLENYPPELLSADIVTAPHHGLMRVLPEFYDAVSPEFVIICNSEDKSETQTAQVTKRGIPYLHTADGILMILETDGTDWYIQHYPNWGLPEEEDTPGIW